MLGAQTCGRAGPRAARAHGRGIESLGSRDGGFSLFEWTRSLSGATGSWRMAAVAVGIVKRTTQTNPAPREAKREESRRIMAFMETSGNEPRTRHAGRPRDRRAGKDRGFSTFT
jgi:hypothetical protein